MPAMYINNLPENLQSTVKLFADDALLYGVITSDSDYDRLQDDLYKLEQWQDICTMADGIQPFKMQNFMHFQ